MSYTKKVLFIGIDAADYRIVKELFRLNMLPNLRRVSQGTLVELESTIPPNTAPSWTSMMTGTNPGKHGIYFFRKMASGKLQSSSDVSSPYIWEWLGAAGKSSIVVNVPLTYPIRRFSGIMISGVHARRASVASVFPSSLIPSIESAYEFEESWFSNFRESLRGWHRAYRRMLSGDSKRVSVFKQLLESKDWDFGCIVLVSLDKIQHAIWNIDGGPKGDLPNRYIIEAYRYVDNLVGVLLEVASTSGAVVVVASDHGFETKMTVHVNVLLASMGLARQKVGMQRLMEALRVGATMTASRLPPGMQSMIRTSGGILRGWLNNSEVLSDSMDYRESQAYSFEYGLIRLNSSAQNRSRMRTILARNLENELHKHMSFKVQLAEGREIYWGEKVPDAPDILILPQSGIQYDSIFAQSVIETQRTADHSMSGILLSNIKFTIPQKRKPRPWDVGATIISLFGLKVPPELDGKPLLEIEGDFAVDRPAIDFINQNLEYSADEQAEIHRRLQSLGYE